MNGGGIPLAAVQRTESTTCSVLGRFDCPPNVGEHGTTVLREAKIMIISSMRRWMLLGRSLGQSALVQAGVELVQLTTANIDLYVTGDARKVVVPGDCHPP